MTTKLPAAVSRYLAAADRGDASAVVACFTEDATVLDEDRQWHGHDGIREWRDSVATAYQYTVEVSGAEARGAEDDAERVDVYTHLEGNFPGGTVDLTSRFWLQRDRIARLEIVPR
jgi:ketosteroid isomerase-like protein